MATTENLYTGNGSTVLYSFTFPYLNTTDVKVTLDGTATTAYSLANATQVQFTTAPASGVAIRIFRETASNELSASFFSGASIRANDLNNNFLQNLYVTQETEFDVNTANTTADAAKTTADSAVVTANSAASDAASAVTTANTANTNATAAQTAATNAAASATAAQTSATAAQTSATAAQTSATSAQNSATAAASDAASALSTANTANTNASAAVTTANTASTTASSAVTTANTANTNATAAQTAASNAATDASNAQSSATAAQTSATAAQNSATAAAASAAASQNVADAFTATGTPATALSVDVPIDAANGVKLPTNSNSYDEEGAIRYNTTLDKIEIRKGSGWSTAAGGATVSSTPPSLATAGDVWYDHDNGRAYVYYNDGDSNQWVEMNPSWNGYVSDNSVTSAKIVDGTIVNADINASAAIAGTKIDPNFGSQNIFTTGSVGINNTSPSSYNGSADNLIVGNTGSNGITIVTGTTSQGSLFFADGTSGTAVAEGYLIYEHTANYLALGTTNTERMRIDSSGNVGIGTASPSEKLEVATSSGVNGLSIRAENYLNASTTMGANIKLYCDQSAIWTGTRELARIAVMGNGSDHRTGSLSFFTKGGSADSAVTERLRIANDGTLQLRNSPGIDFSQIQTNVASMTSETLDSYEEGTFTPDVRVGSTSCTVFGTKLGTYTKIGRTVYFQCAMTNVAKPSATGIVAVYGLPFTVGSLANVGYAQGVIRWQGIASSSLILPYIGESTTYIILQDYGTSGFVANTDDADVSSGGFNLWGISGFYMV